MLERISGFTCRGGQGIPALQQVESEVTHETCPPRSKSMESRMKDECETSARGGHVAQAIQRCAADHVAEADRQSWFPLPNDEMKGRIIGREGRNIRTLETATGVDLIIDDTPEAVIVSAFDPVRREIARHRAGEAHRRRPHPSRPHRGNGGKGPQRGGQPDPARRASRPCLKRIMHGIHHELVKLLGRLRYRTSYGQNVLQALHRGQPSGRHDGRRAGRGRVSWPSGRACSTTSARPSITSWKAPMSTLGVELAAQVPARPPDVIHAIAAHHNDVEPQTVEAVSGAGGRTLSPPPVPARAARTWRTTSSRLEKLEEIANSFPAWRSRFAIQSGREVRIMVKPEDITDDGTDVLAREMAKRIENELEYPGQIKVNVIRETKVSNTQVINCRKTPLGESFLGGVLLFR
ncbi:MAG: KH domain-containing protein [Dysosmobacter sp.]